MRAGPQAGTDSGLASWHQIWCQLRVPF